MREFEPRTAIHCTSSNQARILINEAYKQGYEWCHGLKNETHYMMYRKNTVYYFNDRNGTREISYGHIRNYSYYADKVVEFDNWYKEKRNEN